MIDENLVESLKFIKEGQFDERVGAPALKLVGEVSPVKSGGPAIAVMSHSAIFQEDILEKFIEQTKVSQPIQYIYAGLAQSRMWLPIFYYARMSGKSNAEISGLVEALRVSQKGKKRVLLERLARRRSAYTATVTQAAKAVSVDIARGRINPPVSIRDVLPFVHGLTAARKTAASLGDLLESIRKAREIAEAVDDANAVGAIFKAACWVDELFFAD